MAVFSQKGAEKIQLLTSAECNTCKIAIEEKLNYTKGIRFVELDVPSKVLTVSFIPKKISLDSIKTIVSELGFDVDNVKANKEAYNALPECCKANGMISR